MAETGRRKVRLDELDIDKVPLPSTLVADLGRVAVAVAMSWPVKVSVSAASSIATLAREAGSR